MQPIMLVVGTRPEGIKIAPVYFSLKQAGLPIILCATSQHDRLLAEVFSIFNIKPDIDLKIMRSGQDLYHITTTVLLEMKRVFLEYSPQLVLVQGDTTTVMAAGMAAFYSNIPVGHIEAGLRTGDMYAPYPEEFNRATLGLLASYHFAPTAQAAAHLLAEGKKRESIYCVGNTVVDALRIMEYMIQQKTCSISTDVQAFFSKATQTGSKTVLFTMHRRESFGEKMIAILQGFKEFAQSYPDVHIVYPYHPNPQVLSALESVDLRTVPNIMLMQPLGYADLVYTLLHVDLIITDSGGIQEEGVSLGKKVIVLREKSERMEGVWEGLATLVGTDKNLLIHTLEACIRSFDVPQEKKNVYGDGFSANRITKIIQDQCLHTTKTASGKMSIAFSSVIPTATDVQGELK